MIGRVRKPIKNKIHIGVDEKFHQKYNNHPQNEKKLLQCIMYNNNDFFKNRKIKKELGISSSYLFAKDNLAVENHLINYKLVKYIHTNNNELKNWENINYKIWEQHKK